MDPNTTLEWLNIALEEEDDGRYHKDNRKEDIMTETTSAIIAAKRNAGPNAYLWVHDSGDVILWASEADSVDDDGLNAIQRWHVDGDTIDALIASGEAIVA